MGCTSSKRIHYALVTLDRYCNHQSLNQALSAAQDIHAELREFLAIELNYTQLSQRSRELLNGLAAFRQSVPFEAAEWVLGQKLQISTDFLEEIKKSNSAQFAGLGDDAILAIIQKAIPERREAGDINGPIRELVDWGLLTPIQEGGELRELAVHALVRDFCRDKQAGKGWTNRLRDAAAFYTNLTKMIRTEDKSQASVWNDMEAFELLMEAEEFDQACELLSGTDKLLNRWGFGQYLESQYRRLLEKLDPSSTSAILHNLGTLVQERGDYDKALECHECSLNLANELGDRYGVAASLHQIGNIHYLRGNFEQALEYYNRSRKILIELGNRLGEAPFPASDRYDSSRSRGL